MDWSADQPPTDDAITGCGVIQQGHVHIKTIGENGGHILGFRDLCLDGIEPNLFRDAWGATCVQRGFDWLRPYDRTKDTDLPVFPTWGYTFIKELAERNFGSRRNT